MKFRWILLICLILYSLGCSSAEQINRIMENGAEVVLNHQDPYKLAGRAATFDLETVLILDTERPDIIQAGMGSAGEFDVDVVGNIYIVGFKNQRDFIYRFSPNGKILNSFGRMGQGPGELEWPFLIGVFEDGRIEFTDRMSKYVVFDKNGVVVREYRPGFAISQIFPLANGNFVLQKPLYESGVSVISLCGPDFKDIKELDRARSDSGNERLVRFNMWRVSAGHIYIVNEDRGYEILDYDFRGNLRRKIRKDYRLVAPTAEIKKAFLGSSWNQPGLNGYFPNPMPPLSLFFVDDEGRFFVMTYERGEKPGEYLCDIFNSDGVFIGRKSLDLLWAGLYGGPKYATVKKGLLYSCRVKESGYHQIFVQKMIWK
jgi:hypothetical protein